MCSTDVAIVIIYSGEGGVDGCLLPQGGERGGGIEENGSEERIEDVIEL